MTSGNMQTIELYGSNSHLLSPKTPQGTVRFPPVIVNVVFPLCISRQTTLAVYFMSLVGMIVYAATLSLGHLWVVFITAGALG